MGFEEFAASSRSKDIRILSFFVARSIDSKRLEKNRGVGSEPTETASMRKGPSNGSRDRVNRFASGVIDRGLAGLKPTFPGFNENAVKMVPEVSLSTNWRLLVTLAAVLLITVGPAFAGPKDTDSNQEQGRSPSLDALKRGYLASEQGEHEVAYNHYQNALESASTSELRFQAYVGLGSAAAALGRLDEAREQFEQALALRPDNAETLFSLGLVAKEQNRFQEAASLFANAAVRNPALSEAMVELGVVYEILGRHEEAADACWRAVTVSPEDQGALLCLGVARFHLGLYEGASQAFEAVIELNPDSPRARYGLGLAKIYMDDNEGAIAEYVALKPLDPDLAKDLYLRIPVQN